MRGVQVQSGLPGPEVPVPGRNGPGGLEAPVQCWQQGDRVLQPRRLSLRGVHL